MSVDELVIVAYDRRNDWPTQPSTLICVSLSVTRTGAALNVFLSTVTFETVPGFGVDLDGARDREADARRHDAAGERRTRRADADRADQPDLSEFDAAADLVTGFERPAAEAGACHCPRPLR